MNTTNNNTICDIIQSEMDKQAEQAKFYTWNVLNELLQRIQPIEEERERNSCDDVTAILERIPGCNLGRTVDGKWIAEDVRSSYADLYKFCYGATPQAALLALEAKLLPSVK